MSIFANNNILANINKDIKRSFDWLKELKSIDFAKFPFLTQSMFF